jgi:hypothetical protein
VPVNAGRRSDALRTTTESGLAGSRQLHEVGSRQLESRPGSTDLGDRFTATYPGRTDHIRTLVFTAFGLLGVLFVGYVVWLIFRSDFRYSMFWNGWLPDGFEFVGMRTVVMVFR